MMPDYLFTRESLYGVLRNQAEAARAYVRELPDARFQADIHTLVAEVRERFRINPVRLDIASRSMRKDTVQVEVDDGYGRIRGRTAHGQGIRVTVSIPFSGDAELLEWKPSRWQSIFPRALVRANRDAQGGHVELVFEQSAHDPPEAIKLALEREQKCLDFYLQSQAEQIAAESGQIDQAIDEAIARRRELLTKHEGLSAILGIPEAPVAEASPVPPVAMAVGGRVRRTSSSASDREWDAFVSHASEDKATVARPLAEALGAAGIRVWYDEFTLRVGDSLRRSIDHGLARSRYGIVVLSEVFFAKNWPKRELDGLFARESDGRKVILPVWHEVTATRIAELSPMMADRIAVATSDGIANVVARLLQVIRPA